MERDHSKNRGVAFLVSVTVIRTPTDRLRLFKTHRLRPLCRKALRPERYIRSGQWWVSPRIWQSPRNRAENRPLRNEPGSRPRTHRLEGGGGSVIPVFNQYTDCQLQLPSQNSTNLLLPAPLVSTSSSFASLGTEYSETLPSLQTITGSSPWVKTTSRLRSLFS